MVVELNSSDLLTDEQLNCHIKVSAGPGAGKTHFLVENVKNIVKSNPRVNKSKNRKVLCITYTNSAVEEIKSRLENYKDVVSVYTIHSFIIEYVIKPYQSELKKHIANDFQINVAKNSVITSQIEGLDILHGHDRENIHEYVLEEVDFKEEVSYSKKIMGEVQVCLEEYNNTGNVRLVGSNKIDKEHLSSIKKYTWLIANKLTHDEILYFGNKIVRENPTITYALRVQFPFIFVDEFQDTNPLQAHLIEHLGKKSTIVGTIGDIAQSIYSFQGAKPSKFKEFSLPGDREVNEYEILSNRRSTKNIVDLCNYIRKSDGIIQTSTKQYENEENKKAETNMVYFIVGNSKSSDEKINNIVSNGGVVLTRTWAAAFNYMYGVSLEQKKLLKDVYNSYFPSAINIRSEISEHGNVTWVRAFKFIHSLYEAFRKKSVADIIHSFSLYAEFNKIKKSSSVALIVNINELLKELFEVFDGSLRTIELVERFNSLLDLEKYQDIMQILANNSEEKVFNIPIFDDEDRDKLVDSVSALEWITSYKLFKEVFSEDSKYMTVHQAKGLEWKQVVVGVEPSKRFDKTNFLEMFLNPEIISETPQDEFTRLFYVACSRAEEELYIHLHDSEAEIAMIKESLDDYCAENNIKTFYQFYY